jgi:hypothetical protein
VTSDYVSVGAGKHRILHILLSHFRQRVFLECISDVLEIFRFYSSSLHKIKMTIAKMKNNKAPVDMKWCSHDKKKQEDQ